MKHDAIDLHGYLQYVHTSTYVLRTSGSAYDTYQPFSSCSSAFRSPNSDGKGMGQGKGVSRVSVGKCGLARLASP